MFEVQMLIPRNANDGGVFSDDHHVDFELTAVGFFGGVPRLPSNAVGALD